MRLPWVTIRMPADVWQDPIPGGGITDMTKCTNNFRVTFSAPTAGI